VPPVSTVVAPSAQGVEAPSVDEHIGTWASIVASPAVRLAGRRLLQAIPVLWGVTFLTYLFLNLLPGDAASQLLGANATPAEIKALSIKLHLNEPFLVRYWHWFTAVLHGNLGTSLANGQSVSTIMAQRLPVTFELVLVSVIVAVILAVPMAVLAARKPRGIFDRVTTILSMGGISIAQFVFALLLVLLFSDIWNVLPALGYTALTQNIGENARYMVLPVATIAIPLAMFVARLLRADLIEQMDSQEYIVTARAKGLSRWSQLVRHALRNSMIAIVTIFGLQVALLFGLTVIVEEIFGLPGIGQALLTAINDRDAPLVEGIVLVLAGIVVLANLLIDVTYGLLDPRIRHGRSSV
jgi:peptide/nickel transport system permease protein